VEQGRAGQGRVSGNYQSSLAGAANLCIEELQILFNPCCNNKKLESSDGEEGREYLF
jgi:hypothetical protein